MSGGSMATLGFTDRSAEYTAKAKELIAEGKALEFVANTIGKFHKGDTELALLMWLSTLGIYQPYKVHWLLVGQPGSGKSNLARSVLKTIPEGHKESYASASPRSLYYAGDGGVNLSGRTLYFDDVTPNSEMIDLLKAVATDSREELRHITVDDHRKFKDLTIPTDIQMIVTTIQSLTDQQGQMLRRYLIVNPDESEEALKAACEMIQEEARLIPALTRKDAEQELEITKIIYKQIMSENVDVVIPFKFDFGGVLKHSDKTAIKAFVTLVKCHALANYKNRVRIGDVILAAPEDLEKISELWRGNIREQKIDRIAEDILNYLPDCDPLFTDTEESAEFGCGPCRIKVQKTGMASDIAQDLKIAPSTVTHKLDHLYKMGLTDRREAKARGRPYVNWKSDTGKGEARAATVKWENYGEDVKHIVRKIAYSVIGSVEISEEEVNEICSAPAIRSRKETELVEAPDTVTDGAYSAKQIKTEDNGPDSNGATRGENGGCFLSFELNSARQKTTAPIDERDNEASLYIIAAEKGVKEECVVNSEIPNTADLVTDGKEFVCMACNAPFPNKQKLAEHYPYCPKYRAMQTKEAKTKTIDLTEKILQSVRTACEEVEAFDIEALTNKISINYFFTKEEVQAAISELLKVGILEQTTNEYNREAVKISTQGGEAA